MSDDVSRLPVTACEGASLDDNHWSGVAAGEPFELHLKFDGTLYATDTFPVRMLRSTDGLEVVCREPLHSRFTTKAGGRSKYHVEKWCRKVLMRNYASLILLWGNITSRPMGCINTSKFLHTL